MDALSQDRLVCSHTPTVGQVITSWADAVGNRGVLARFLIDALARPVDEGDAIAGPDGQPQRATLRCLTVTMSVRGRVAQVTAGATGGVAPIQASDIAVAIGQVLSQPTR